MINAPSIKALHMLTISNQATVEHNMGNSVQSTARSSADGDNGAEANWSHFPRGTKELFYQYYSRLHSLGTFSQSAAHKPQRTSEVVFSSPGTVRDGLDLVVNFIILSSQLFVNDRTYDWNNLNQTLKAAYTLTAEFLLKNKRGGGKTMLLLVYAGFLEECISRGFGAVCSSWIVVYNGGVEITRLNDDLFFDDLAHLHLHLNITRSTKTMAFFLSGKISKYANSTQRWTRRLNHMLNEQLPSTPLHTFDTGVVCPAVLLKVKIVYSDGPAFIIELDVYNDTTLACVFRNCMTLAHGDSNEPLTAKLFPELCLWSLRTKYIFYLSSDSNKTVGELEIKDGDAFQVLRDPQDVNRFSASSTVKGKDHRSIRFPSFSLLACGSSVYP